MPAFGCTARARRCAAASSSRAAPAPSTRAGSASAGPRRTRRRSGPRRPDLEDQVEHDPVRVLPRVAAGVPRVRVEDDRAALLRGDALLDGQVFLVAKLLVEDERVAVAVLDVVEQALVA